MAWRSCSSSGGDAPRRFDLCTACRCSVGHPCRRRLLVRPCYCVYYLHRRRRRLHLRRARRRRRRRLDRSRAVSLRTSSWTTRRPPARCHRCSAGPATWPCRRRAPSCFALAFVFASCSDLLLHCSKLAANALAAPRQGQDRFLAMPAVCRGRVLAAKCVRTGQLECACRRL